MFPVSRLAWLVLTSIGVLACSPKPAATLPPTDNGYAGVNCSAVRPQPEPDLMAWDGTSRVQLDKLRRQGVVAVRYEARGCEVSLELLPQCIGPKNRYAYSPFRASNTKIARDANELFTQLPVGAANVSGLLKGHRAIRTDVKLVGSVALPAGSTITEYDLIGPECRRATHVISAVYVGGFAMASGEQAEVKAAANLFARPAGSIEGMTREGYAAICDRAEKEGIELDGCSVPLRVALTPLDGKVPPPSCSPGFSFDGKRCARDGSDETLAPSGDKSAAGEPSTEPRVFDQNAIERVVREGQGGVKRRCWEPMPESLRRINVVVTTRVDTQGRVARADAQLVDAEGPADVAGVVARCIAGEIGSWQFPAPDSEKVLALPFHLIRQ